MKSMVVFFALASVACASWAPLPQPPHTPAIVLDARGRPLDTAEVINARALHLQAKALEGSGHYGLAPAYGYQAPLLAPTALGYAGHGHYLYKRSLGHYAYAAPSAVSHQSRVDVISSPAVVSHAVAAPVLAHAAPAVAVAPIATAAVLPVASHGAIARVNHAAVAPIGYATPYNYGYLNAAPLAHAW